jgi:hypothetical protein
MGDKEIRHIGTWRMVRGWARQMNGAPRPAPYGPNGMGLLTLSANGRMMAVLCDGRATLPDGTLRDYASYCGNYTFDGKTLVTRVDATSTSRAAIGGDQIRQIRFDNGQMLLIQPAAGVNGGVEYREVYWERISEQSA